MGEEIRAGLNCGGSALRCPVTQPARAADGKLDIVANKRYSLTAMSNMQIDYEALGNLDTDAFLEFEEELKRKIARQTQEEDETGKKKRGRRR